MKEATCASSPSAPTAPASDENRHSEADFGSFPCCESRANTPEAPRVTGGPASSQTPRRVFYHLPSAIDSWRSRVFFLLVLPMISAAVLTTEEVVCTATEALAGTRPSEGSVRSCSPRSLEAESHRAAPLRLPARGCCRRLSLSAAVAAVTAAPDHIKLSYSSDNNFRLLRSGPPYSQQWL